MILLRRFKHNIISTSMYLLYKHIKTNMFSNESNFNENLKTRLLGKKWFDITTLLHFIRAHRPLITIMEKIRMQSRLNNYKY